MHDACQNGRKRTLLTVVAECTRAALAIDVATVLAARRVPQVLAGLFAQHGAPQCLRSDNGSAFGAKLRRHGLPPPGATRLDIDPGSPWQNGIGESFNGKFRDEGLTREVFLSVQDARVQREHWRRMYNAERPQSSFG